jgi:hypothetical protein
MSIERRPAGPTWYGERRTSEMGITSVMLSVQETSGVVTLVGGDAEAARRTLVPELLYMANLVLRNPAEAVALEILGSVTVSPHGCQLGVAVDDDGAVTMSETNHLTVCPDARHRVRYLAVAGGIAPGFGTAGVGRPVVVGDLLRPGCLRGALVGGPGRIDLRPGDPIGVRPGAGAPSHAAGAFEALCATRWQVLPDGDRGSFRLAPERAAALAPPAPVAGTKVVRGALSVAADGSLVVAGPDHPSTGSSPVLALVDDADIGRLAARPIGASVTFVAR